MKQVFRWYNINFVFHIPFCFTISMQAYYAREAGYLMILLVVANDCNFNGKECILLLI